MNGLHFAIFAFIVFGATYWIPRLIRHDRLMRDIEALDDEELAAALELYPDLFDRARKW